MRAFCVLSVAAASFLLARPAVAQTDPEYPCYPAKSAVTVGKYEAGQIANVELRTQAMSALQNAETINNMKCGTRTTDPSDPFSLDGREFDIPTCDLLPKLLASLKEARDVIVRVRGMSNMSSSITTIENYAKNYCGYESAPVLSLPPVSPCREYGGALLTLQGETGKIASSGVRQIVAAQIEEGIGHYKANCFPQAQDPCNALVTGRTFVEFAYGEFRRNQATSVATPYVVKLRDYDTKFCKTTSGNGVLPRTAASKYPYALFDTALAVARTEANHARYTGIATKYNLLSKAMMNAKTDAEDMRTATDPCRYMEFGLAYLGEIVVDLDRILDRRSLLWGRIHLIRDHYKNFCS